VGVQAECLAPGTNLGSRKTPHSIPARYDLRPNAHEVHFHLSLRPGSLRTPLHYQFTAHLSHLSLLHTIFRDPRIHNSRTILIRNILQKNPDHFPTICLFALFQ
jgi:hypothetical protein